MRPFATAVLFTVLALPVAAQQGGMANRTSPTVGQSIAFTSGCSVDIKYKAITWAQGKFMETLKTPEGRDRTNKDLKNNPTGTLTASHDIAFGGQAVKAGTHKLYFEVDGDQKFHLVLADEAGKETKWKLDLTEKTEAQPRLSLTLTAGKAATEASIGVTFGKMSCAVAVSADASAAKKETPKEAAAPAKTDKGEGKETAKTIR